MGTKDSSGDASEDNPPAGGSTAVRSSTHAGGKSMLVKTFTFVRKREELSREDFFARWVEHTQRFDLEDHPYITLNRLTMIEGETPYVGIAENHWPDRESLDRTAEFYEKTERGRAHWADLCEFMDIDGSPTVIVTAEAEVSPEGVLYPIPPAERT